MSEDIPIGVIKKIVHTTVPITDDGTLVDDASILVDGTQLVGGQTSPDGNIKVNLTTTVPRNSLKVNR